MIVRHGGGFVQEDGMFAGNDNVIQHRGCISLLGLP